jgi:ubiquinone/menaquinone biosynthesis C-methylase UbiE
MQRVDTRELLDSPDCPPHEIAASLRDMARVNRWFGGVATTRKLIERVASATGRTHFSMLEVAAGFGEVPRAAGQQLARKGITLEVTHVDLVQSHLLRGMRAVVADALALPFLDNSFDLVSCSLFAHHLEPAELARFTTEALRVSRCAVLINDLIRHPLHLALVYAGFPFLRSYVSRNDGPASVRRAYIPEEMRRILSSVSEAGNGIEILQNFLFRMGVILWKRREPAQATAVELRSTGKPGAAVPT